MRDVLAGRGSGDGRTHALGIQHCVHHGAAVRQVRPDHGGADAPEVHAQHARQFALQALDALALRFLAQVVQRDRRREAHDGVAPVQQHRQQPTEMADHRPVFREQHAEPAGLPARCATHVDRHRHQLHVAIGRGLEQAQQVPDGILGGVVATAPLEPAADAAHREHGAAAFGHARHPRERTRQPRFAAGPLQDQAVGKAVALDHVDHRGIRCQQRYRLGRIALDLDPGPEQGPPQGTPPAGMHEGLAGQGLGHHVCHRFDVS